MWGFFPGFLATLSTGGGGGSLPLDTLTVAPFFAVSYRKLRSAYGGNCCRIRRYSDNSEQDFGFVSNVVDTAGIITFVTDGGSAIGLVTKRYNQAAGATVNAVQPTVVNQPAIYNGGFTLPIGTHGGVSDYMPVSNRSMQALSVPLGGTALQGIVVGLETPSQPSFAMGVQIKGTTDGASDAFSSALSAVFCAWGGPRVFIDRNGAHAAATFNNDIAGAAPGSNNAFVHSAVFNGSTLNAYFNGTLVLTAPSTGTFGSLVNINIGTDDGTNNWDGGIPEIILQAGANSSDRTALETSANTFWRT